MNYKVMFRPTVSVDAYHLKHHLQASLCLNSTIIIFFMSVNAAATANAQSEYTLAVSNTKFNTIDRSHKEVSHQCMVMHFLKVKRQLDVTIPLCTHPTLLGVGNS